VNHDHDGDNGDGYRDGQSEYECEPGYTYRPPT
jgi:hypothetical protein